MTAAIGDFMRRIVPKTREDWDASLKVVTIGLASALLYAISRYATRGMFYNGFDTDFRGDAATGYPFDSGRLVLQLCTYWVANLGLFGPFIWLLLLARRGHLRGPASRLLAFAFPVAIGVGLLCCRPYRSTDLYSYALHGHIGSQPDGNPYLVADASASDMDISTQLVEGDWHPVHGPTPYGPIWSRIEIAGMLAAGQNVTVAIYVYKVIALLACIAAGILIWFTLGRVSPHDQLLGTLIFIWNPLVIVEFAAEGHNDALMVALVIGGLAMCAFSRPATSLVAMAMAVLTKYLPAIFGPAQIVYLWRTREDTRRFFAGFAAASIIAACIAALVYGRLWAGADTFAGVNEVRTPRGSASVPGGLYYVVSTAMPDSGIAEFIAKALSVLFLAFVLAAAWRVTDIDSLFRSCAYVALAYTYFINSRFWPWYVCLPVALMALRPTRRFMWLSLVMSLCARVAAPLTLLNTRDVMSWKYAYGLLTGIGAMLPALIIVFILIRALLHPQHEEPKREDIRDATEPDPESPFNSGAS